MLKRTICVLISVFLIVTLVGCNSQPTEVTGNIEGSAEVERTYTTLYSDNDDLLYENPNRGFRGYVEVVNFEKSEEELVKGLDQWMKRHIDHVKAQSTVCYIYPTDYRGKPLDDKFFNTLQWVFDWARDRKIQLNLRFAYYHTLYFADRTPTTEEIMLHLEQIAENGIVERNKDTIHALQVGFVGRYGEWHSEDTETDHQKIIDTFYEKLLPDGVYPQTRKPEYKNLLADTVPAKKVTGFHMDSFFGIQDSSQYGSGNFSIGMEDWEQAVKEGAYAPQDGELYFQGQFEHDLGFFPDGYACLLGMSQLRMTTFSSENSYLETVGTGTSAMQQWMNQPVTEKWLKEYKLPYSENWFLNQKGETVERSVFEYIRHYLGYRLTATALKTTAADRKLNVSLDLENHGFSAAFNITSRLVILDADGNIVSEAAAGDPTTWHSTNPDNYKDRKQLSHNISAELTLPETAGSYRIGLNLTSKSGATARLDNNIPYEHGCNILHSFEIK